MYYGCSSISALAFNINGRIDTDAKCIALCCEPVENLPAISLEGTAQEIVENFKKMHAGVINEGKRYANNSSGGKRQCIEGCASCANYKLGEWDGDGLIHYVNLSMYPAPCQCKCIYCDVHNSERGVLNKVTCNEHYERLFDTLDYAREIGLIAEDATWQVSSGEIAIHPYKNRIFNLIENQRVMFYTNCFIFDEGIARNLSANPYSGINLSIDAGTPQTWLKVKGVDNFEDIAENLVKYYNASMRPGQITLKYIVLPGINDYLPDYLSLIEIMKVLNVKHLTISRDVSIKYSSNSEQLEDLISASGCLLAMLAKNKMTADMFTFTPEEREKAVAFATKLLQTGEV